MNLDTLRQQIIGNDTLIPTPYGMRLMTYADYTASGRNLIFIEEYLMSLEKIYANTHTEDNYTGSQMTHLYHEAKDTIRTLLGGTEDYVVISTGSGATGAIHKLTQILGVYEAPATKSRCKNLLDQVANESVESASLITQLREESQLKRPLVFITPYEHHSNVLTWRESDTQVIELKLSPTGGVDLDDLKQHLSNPIHANRLKIGAFSAASNVTGMISPIRELTQLMHAYDGYAFFDFAASAPYVRIQAYESDDYYIDGLYFSPHKFLGGPGSTGILLLHKNVYKSQLAPTCPGGGTVDYVNRTTHDFKTNIEEREDAGTPAILQTIRSALALKLQAAIGYETIESLEFDYLTKALELLGSHPSVQLIGQDHPHERLGIVSFNIRHQQGLLHPRFVTKLLNDLFGIQARAGCSCAGPYGHQLLGIPQEKSIAYRDLILEGYEVMKPGWVRVNFHYILDHLTFTFLLEAILFIADYGYLFLQDYDFDPKTGLWHNQNETIIPQTHLSLDDALKNPSPYQNKDLSLCQSDINEYLSFAHLRKNQLFTSAMPATCYGIEQWPSLAWFYTKQAN